MRLSGDVAFCRALCDAEFCLRMLDDAACLFWFADVGRCGVRLLRRLGDAATNVSVACAVVRRSEPSRVATKVLSKVTAEILSFGTFEVQATLLSKLTTILIDPTAEAQLSQQSRRDWPYMKKMLNVVPE